MSFEAKVLEYASASGVENDVLQFLEAQKCFTVRDVALLSTSLKECKEDIVAPMVQGNVASAKTMIGTVQIKKLWLACWQAMEASDAPRAPELATDAPIPQPEEMQISKAWLARHGMVLPDSFLLIDTTQGRIWRDFQMDPPRIAVWLAEKLRTKASINQAIGHQLALIPGQPAVTETIIVDHVERSFELYIRARAFFHTLSYVTVLTPGYFPLQSAMLASELVLASVCAQYSGRAPPVQFMVQAWAETVHYYSESARMSRRTMKEIVENVAAWENRWKWSPMPGDGTGVRVPVEPDSRDLQNTVSSMRGQLKAMQKAQGGFGQRQQRTSDVRARPQEDEQMQPSSRRRKRAPNVDSNSGGGNGSGGYANGRSGHANRQGGGGGGNGKGGGRRGGGASGKGGNRRR